MPAVLEGRECASCRRRHVLCSPDTHREEAGVMYEYDCPTTGSPVRHTIDRWTRFDVTCPADAVLVRRARNSGKSPNWTESGGLSSSIQLHAMGATRTMTRFVGQTYWYRAFGSGSSLATEHRTCLVLQAGQVKSSRTAVGIG
jgi:hypothetical protein